MPPLRQGQDGAKDDLSVEHTVADPGIGGQILFEHPIILRLSVQCRFYDRDDSLGMGGQVEGGGGNVQSHGGENSKDGDGKQGRSETAQDDSEG